MSKIGISKSNSIGIYKLRSPKDEFLAASQHRLLETNKLLEEELRKKNAEMEKQNQIWSHEVNEYFHLVEKFKKQTAMPRQALPHF